MFDNPRRLRRPEERVGTVTNADLPPPAMTQQDAMLVERIRARDDSAFELLLEQFHPAMLRVALNFVRTREEAEDVIQETWIAVLAGISRFEGRSSFKTWLFRILINRARTRAKREARSVPLSALAPVDGSEAGAAGSELAPHRASSSAVPRDPEQAVLDAELRGFLERAVGSLPRPQRLVLSLRDIEGFSAQEVCETLKISSANQRVLLHRARMRVREDLMPYLGERVAVG